MNLDCKTNRLHIVVQTFQEWFVGVKIFRVEHSTTTGKIDHLPKLLDTEIDIKRSFVPSHDDSFDLTLCQQTKCIGTDVCGLGENKLHTKKPTTCTTNLVW